MKGLVLIFALLMVSITQASKSNVVHLTAADFEEKTGDGKVYFIKFFAPWCGHCKRMAPAWDELSEKLKDQDDIVIASVDCTQHRSVCDQADIKGFPTLKVYQNGKGGEMYKGAREVQELKKYVEEQRKLLLQETTE